MSECCHCLSFPGKNLLVTSKAADGGHSAPSMEDMHRTSCDLPYRPLLSGTLSHTETSSNHISDSLSHLINQSSDTLCDIAPSSPERH